MADEAADPEVPLQPEDPQHELEQHVKFRRRQEVANLTLSQLIAQNLSDFRPVMNGLTHAYTALKIRNAGLRELTEILRQYQHLRKVDLGFNLLVEVPALYGLKYVTHLDLSRNLLTNVAFLAKEGLFPYLREINLQGNKIDGLPVILVRNLRRVNLNNNLISSLEEFNGHPLIEVLELRGNRLASLKGLQNLPALRELYIAQNSLSSLKQLQKVDRLQKINARKNRIAQLSPFPHVPSLVYLNLRQNLLAKVQDLRGVGQSVRNINLLGNPIEAELADNTKKQVWMRYRHYSRINKSEVTAQQREDYDKQYKDRLAEQQRQRLERQAAERETREQEQNKEQS